MISNNSKIESIEVIPMNKESIFDEPYSEDEIVNIAITYEEWETFNYNRTNEMNSSSTFNSDFKDEVKDDLLEFAKKAKGYMINPTAKIGTKMIVAKTYKANSIEELNEKIDPNKIYIYMIYYTTRVVIEIPQYINIEKLSYDEIQKIPNRIKTDIVIRYAE